MSGISLRSSVPTRVCVSQHSRDRSRPAEGDRVNRLCRYLVSIVEVRVLVSHETASSLVPTTSWTGVTTSIPVPGPSFCHPRPQCPGKCGGVRGLGETDPPERPWHPRGLGRTQSTGGRLPTSGAGNGTGPSLLGVFPPFPPVAVPVKDSTHGTSVAGDCRREGVWSRRTGVSPDSSGRV